MLRFIAKRILVTIPVLLGVTFIIFGMMYLTRGNPARMMLGDLATDEEVAQLEDEAGAERFFFYPIFYLFGQCAQG